MTDLGDRESSRTGHEIDPRLVLLIRPQTRYSFTLCLTVSQDRVTKLARYLVPAQKRASLFEDLVDISTPRPHRVSAGKLYVWTLIFCGDINHRTNSAGVQQ